MDSRSWVVPEEPLRVAQHHLLLRTSTETALPSWPAAIDRLASSVLSSSAVADEVNRAAAPPTGNSLKSSRASTFSLTRQRRQRGRAGLRPSPTAREALALALTGMMNDREITRERAVELARMVLRENAIKLYGF